MKTILSAAAMLLFVTTVHAAPVHFQFNQSIAFTDIPGVAVTDTATIDVFMDNGGTGTVNQLWLSGAGHYVSGSVTVGSYSMNLGPTVTFANFVTDFGGALLAAQVIDGPGVDNTDNFGGGGLSVLFDFGVQSSVGTVAFFTASTEVIANWQIVPTSEIPAPAPFALLGLGLVAMLGTRRIRRQS